MAASHVVLVASFFLLTCMHFSSARLLLDHAAIVNSSATAKPHRFSISLQVSEERRQNGPSSPKVEYEEFFAGNAQDKKIDRHVYKEGSEIVESSSSHHVALLKGKHVKDWKSCVLHIRQHKHDTPRYIKNEVVVDQMSDDIVVMDYQPAHRKTPIHNK